jgi:cytochrome c-type protein NapC
MSLGLFGVIAILAFNLAVVTVLIRRPSLFWVAGGRVLIFLSILVLPALGFTMGFLEHVDRAKRTEFCVSCHVMEPYGRSLQIDSADHLPAAHFQNARVDQERACFVCHTNYSMFGDIQAKLNGLQHIYVNYVTGPPEEMELYQPYQNRECFSCHANARSFEENDFHVDIRAELEANEFSCLECHAANHDVPNLTNLKTWEPGP